MLTHTRLWTATALCIGVLACGAPRPSNQVAPHAVNGSHASDEAAKTVNGDKPGDAPQHDVGKMADDGDSERAAADRRAPDHAPETQPSAAKAQSAQPPSERSLAEICDKLTRRANQKCAKHVASLYQSSCNHYLKKPGDCAEPIRLVLECQFQAGDEALCAHEADHKCLALRRALKECQHGTPAPDQNMAEDLTVPPGWKEIRDEALGFVVSMPQTAALDTTAKARTWKAEDADVEYYVTALQPLSEKPTSQAWIRSIIGHVGTRCQNGLRLHGELELKGTTVVQYHTACPDKTEWHGMLHVFKGKTVATSYHAPAGVTGIQEPFFYSFRVAD